MKTLDFTISGIACYFCDMIRGFIIILLSSIGSLLCIPAFSQTLSLTLPVRPVSPSATQIDVPIQLNGTASVGSFQFAITYDATQLSYVGPILSGTLLAGQNVIFNGATPGEVRGAFAAAVGTLPLNTGVLCTLRFNRVSPTAPLSYLVWNRSGSSTFFALGNGSQISPLQTNSGVIYPQGVTTTIGTNNGDQSVCELDTARFTVTGSNATQYQWYFSTDISGSSFLPVNSSNYPYAFSGAQAAQLVLPNVLQGQQSGIYYYCRLSSAQGTILSRAQQLTVQSINSLFNSSIISNPGLPLCSGLPVQFRMNIPVPVAQARWLWKVDGFPVGTDSTLILQNPQTGQVVSCEVNGANCVYATADLSIVVGAPPISFPMSGGGVTCSRGPRLPIGLGGSQTGTKYVLLRNGISTNDTVNGTGLAISFPPQLVAGLYKVRAINGGGTGCASLFPDSISINHFPILPKSVSPNTSLVLGGSTILTATGGGGTATYNWYPTSGLSSNQGSSVVASPAQTTQYFVSVEDFFGCRDTLSVLVTVLTSQPQSVLFSTKCLLEGLYLGSGQMRPALYQLGISTSVNAADSIEIGFWNPTNLSVAVRRETVVLATNGIASVLLPATYRNNSYYISIKNRNSLEIWSASPILILDSLMYDFTTSLTSAYSNGSNPPMKLMPGGGYALYGGDINLDGAIDISDISSVWAASFGSPAPAYVATDLSGDGIPDISDLSTVWANTFNSLFYARP